MEKKEKETPAFPPFTAAERKRARQLFNKHGDTATERQRVYQQINDAPGTKNWRKEQGYKEVPMERFQEVGKLYATWNATHGEKHEELMKSDYSLHEMKNWYEKAAPAFRELAKVLGVRICAMDDCMKTIAKGRVEKKYCSEQCRSRARKLAQKVRESSEDITP